MRPRIDPSSSVKPDSCKKNLCPMDIESKQIEKDSKVVIDLQSANRNKTIFGEDADTFNPNRSLPKDSQDTACLLDKECTPVLD